jgi:hypothetical protein
MSAPVVICSLLGMGALLYVKNQLNVTGGTLVKVKTCKSGKCESMSVIDTTDKERASRQLMTIFLSVRPVYDAMRKRPGYVDRGPLKVSDIMESDGYLTSDNRTTYLYDKNDMYVCLRNADGKIYADTDDNSGTLNHILYVVLHELTHKLTQSWNHTPAFWNNFRVVLQEAIDQGVYIPGDFSQSPWTHCGKTYVNSGGGMAR